MTQTTTVPRNQTIVGSSAGQFMERFMAVDEVERKFIVTEPRLRREIWFQVVALILCPISFGYAVFNVAISLLRYSALSTLTLAAGAAFSLFTIDQHYLIQARGDTSEHTRKAIIKVRILSIAIISLSFILMASHTFQEDIQRVLAEAKQARRAELEQSPRYKLDLDEARDTVTRVNDAVKRAEELQANISQLQVKQAAAWEGRKNECEGNTTGNEIRKSGCGAKARGFEATANRLGMEIEVARQELAQLGKVAERSVAAKQQLAAVEARIDQDASRSISGSQRQLDALWVMLKSSLTAWFAVGFWLFVGMIPDMLMLAAQRRMFNHELFVRMRAVRNEVQQARLAQLRSELRQQQADKLVPIEVRLAAVPKSGGPQTAEAAALHRHNPPRNEDRAG